MQLLNFTIVNMLIKAVRPRFSTARARSNGTETGGGTDMTALADNLAKLNGFLARFRENGVQNRIAGQDRPGAGGVFQTHSPVDTSVICDVALGTATDIDAAACAARDAFADWRDMPATQRRAILMRIADRKNDIKVGKETQIDDKALLQIETAISDLSKLNTRFWNTIREFKYPS